ncbi:hypothetical protein K432DRAFT_427873 [Lepidopterella palustris CBS 459.81]|uniref:Uncharacterized protein n=1 Tax=Lepidopterella palustris CBS 459.81 TaxID=1314670 RepID=A0A8E2E5B4_9PEZI|nr:hypothetical protein K432DRAFT_427873 [Lepidopterella palustris CBS 459.81]
MDLSQIEDFTTSFTNSIPFLQATQSPASTTPSESTASAQVSSSPTTISSINASSSINVSAAPTLSSAAPTLLVDPESSTVPTQRTLLTSYATSSSPTTLASPSYESKSVSKATIVGGVIGGSAAVLLAFLLLLFLRRRTREQQRRAATIQPSFSPHEEGISAHLGAGILNDSGPAVRIPKNQNQDSIADSETAVTPFHADEKARLNNVSEDPVPQLDGTPILPTLEMAGSNPDPIGKMPELPAYSTSKRVSDASQAGKKTARTVPKGGQNTDDVAHVMSWTKYDGPKTRTASARLSYPHIGPDMSIGVWSSMGDSAAKVNNAAETKD